MESIPWYKSQTILASIVSAIAGLASIAGHSIDAGTQAQLVNLISTIASGVSLAGAIWAGIARTKTTTVIQGSSAEKAVIQATGVVPTPKS